MDRTDPCAQTRPRPRTPAAVARGSGVLVAAAALGFLSSCGGGHAATTTLAKRVPGVIARGRDLYLADSCSGCHSLNGGPGIGPTWRKLAGSSVTLSTGKTVVADDRFLTMKIEDPGTTTVRGYPPGLMAGAIAGFQLRSHPAEVDALVAFIRSLR